jgi:hypothetical protein
MLAKLTDMPSLPDLLFEPKWDGFRCVLFRDGDDLDLQSRNQKPLMRYFPELREPLLEQLPPQVVLDGELVIATPNGLNFDALQLRQHPAASRVKKLAEEIPASFVAFDLLALGKESVLDEPLRDRRAGLERLLAAAKPPLFLTPATTDRDLAAVVRSFRGCGLRRVVAKPLGDPYAPGARTMLRWHDAHAMRRRRFACTRTARASDRCCSVSTRRRRAPSRGRRGVGWPRRARLARKVDPCARALKSHPWREWAAAMSQRPRRPAEPGGPNRWNPPRTCRGAPADQRVCGSLQGIMNGRFATTGTSAAGGRRPGDCTYSQLEGWRQPSCSRCSASASATAAGAPEVPVCRPDALSCALPSSGSVSTVQFARKS